MQLHIDYDTDMSSVIHRQEASGVGLGRPKVSSKSLHSDSRWLESDMCL